MERREGILKDQCRYLGFGKEAYQSGFVYKEGESVEDRLTVLLNKSENIFAREQLAKNVQAIDLILSDLPCEEIDDVSFDIVLVSIVRQIALDSAENIADETTRKKTVEFIKSLENPGQLLAHLSETGGSVKSFFSSVSPDVVENILSKEKIQLMEFVGRTHDIFKLLGGMNSQIDPDHEIVYKQILGKHLIGKKFVSDSGTIIFTEEHVKFIIDVVSGHEDIWREEQFAAQANSLQRKNIHSDQVDVERARSIFHFIDIFGNAVRVVDGELRLVDKNAFNTRFIDLFQRHIQLPIIQILSDGKTINWNIGKVFRSEWGLHGVAGLTWTFKILNDEWGIKVDPGLVDSVQQGILQVLNDAENALRSALSGKADTNIILTIDSLPKTELESKLSDIVHTKELLENEIG